MATHGNRFSIYAGDPVRAILADTCQDRDGGNRSGRINTVAERYASIMQAEIPALALTESAWIRIITALSGDARRAVSVDTLANIVADAGNGAGGVVFTQIAEQLRALSVVQRTAVLEAAERTIARSDHLALHDAMLRAGIITLPR